MPVRNALLAILFVFGLFGFVKGVVADVTWELTPHDLDRFYDGDTFYINLNGLPPVFGDSLPVRLLDVDTPELRSRCKTEALKEEERRLGRESRDFLIKVLKDASVIRIEDVVRGSFFRVVATVYIDGVNLNQLMVHTGHAVDATDGASADWCEIIAARWAQQ